MTAHRCSVASVTLNGKAYTPAAIKAILQAEIDSAKAVELGRATYANQVANARSATASARALRKVLKAYVLSNFGVGAIDVLGAFGISVPKPKGKAPIAAKAEGLKKAKATREARHTMGKKQKLAVKALPELPVPTAPKP